MGHHSGDKISSVHVFDGLLDTYCFQNISVHHHVHPMNSNQQADIMSSHHKSSKME